MTAQDADKACRAQAATEGRWADGICQEHYLTLDNDACNECLDDAHEAWLVAR